MPPPFRLPLRASGALPAGDTDPLNCLYGGETNLGQLAPLTKAELESLQIPRQALWPSVRMGRGAAAEAGPTGAPWVDANGWLIRLLRFRQPDRQVLLDTLPPPGASPLLAVADAMAYGAAWVVSPTPDSWPPIQQALRFFASRPQWRDWPPVSAVSLIAGAQTDGEILNLLTRRQVGFQLAAPGDTATLHTAAAWISPASVPLDTYLPWVRAGGTLILHGLYKPRAEGQGRILAFPETLDDPYETAARIHLALTRRSDVLRLWNAGSCNSYYQADPGGQRAVVHLIHYAPRRPAAGITLWLARPWRRATLTTFAETAALKPVAANGGIEIPLPPIGVYAAIELEE